MHSNPIEFKVIKSHKEYKVGEKIFWLSSTGDGFGQYWYNGKVLNGDISQFSMIFRGLYGCEEKIEQKRCWVKPINKNKKNKTFEFVYWIKIRLENKVTLWGKLDQDYLKYIKTNQNP